jgi:hypothetical protein
MYVCVHVTRRGYSYFAYVIVQDMTAVGVVDMSGYSIKLAPELKKKR